MSGKDSLYRIDYLLVAAVVATALIGVLMIYSGGFDPIDKLNSGMYKKQILWLIIGFVLMIAITFISYQQLGYYSIYIYAVTLVLLMIPTFLGSPVRNTRAWLNFGLFSIQPSEFMKIALVIILAKYLELRERDMSRFREIMIPMLLTLIPVAIIMKQPDFGTAVTFFPILFVMLFVGGADVAYLMSIISIAVIALVVPMFLTYREWIGDTDNLLLRFFRDTDQIIIISAILIFIAAAVFITSYFVKHKIFRRIYLPSLVLSVGLMSSVIIQRFFIDYQKKRILVFLNPELDPQGSGYNIIQSKIAIGSGEFLGKGFLEGSQSQLGFLPEKTSDFIFSVVAEEWGFIGATVLLLLLAFIIFRGVQVALQSKDKFGALLASGIATILFIHVIINIGMVMGIMPVTGLPLVFVSYGGSNLIMSMLAVGILINIRMRKFVY